MGITSELLDAADVVCGHPLATYIMKTGMISHKDRKMARIARREVKRSPSGTGSFTMTNPETGMRVKINFRLEKKYGDYQITLDLDPDQEVE